MQMSKSVPRSILPKWTALKSKSGRYQVLETQRLLRAILDFGASLIIIIIFDCPLFTWLDKYFFLLCEIKKTAYGGTKMIISVDKTWIYGWHKCLFSFCQILLLYGGLTVAIQKWIFNIWIFDHGFLISFSTSLIGCWMD